MSWFSKKKEDGISDQELMDALANAPTVQIDPNAIAQGQGQGQGLAIGTSGPINVTLTGTQQQQLQQMMGTLQFGLSPEEKKELEELEREHAIKLKTERLSIFKKMDGSIRQSVINALIWKETMEAMNAATVEKSQRQVDLEAKNVLFKNMFIHTQGSNWTYNTGTDLFFNGIALPQGVTVEELKQAHADATLEEEVLNGREEV